MNDSESNYVAIFSLFLWHPVRTRSVCFPLQQHNTLLMPIICQVLENPQSIFQSLYQNHFIKFSKGISYHLFPFHFGYRIWKVRLNVFAETHPALLGWTNKKMRKMTKISLHIFFTNNFSILILNDLPFKSHIYMPFKAFIQCPE